MKFNYKKFERRVLMFSLIGIVLFLSGNVKNNSYFNNLEFIIDKVETLNLDMLIQKMTN